MTAFAVAVYAVLLVAAAAMVWRRPILALYLWIVGLANPNAVMAALYGAGIRGSALTAIQAWKEVLLAVALGRVGFDAVRARRLPFRPGWVDALALTFGAIVGLYAVLPQSALGGSADGHAVGLALKHDLVPAAAFLLGRSLVGERRQLDRLFWTIVATAAGVAVLGLLDDYLIPIGWWRSSAVVAYFHDHLGYNYDGTGGLPENFVYNTGSEDHFLRRLVSVFLSPLASAYLMVVALLLAATLRRRGRLLAVAAAVAAAALLFTFSRSSLIALAAGLVVLAFVYRRWWPVLAAVATIGVSIAWVHAFPHVAPTGEWTARDLALGRENAKEHPNATGDPASGNEPSIRSHLTSLRDGARTVIHHPQGFGLGNAGQTASRTETPIKAGESNYTELGVETGVGGALLWIAWVVGIFVALLRRRAAGVAAAFGAALVLAVQTDVIGDPWMAYVLWSLVGLTLARERVAEIQPAAIPERAWDGRASEARTASVRRRRVGA